LKKIAQVLHQANIKEKLASEYLGLKLRKWQAELLAEVAEPITMNEPKNRKIIWYYDNIGASGKSTVGEFLAVVKDAAIFGSAKTADVLHGFKGQNIAIFDLTRSLVDETGKSFVNYSVIEQLKSNVYFSSKYASSMKYRLGGIYIIVFSNNLPDRSKMSADRWDVRYLDRGELYDPHKQIIDNLPDGI